MFGIDLSGKSSLKLAMAQAVLDKMLDKTADGKSRTGNKFTKYSKSYSESDAFKSAGKSRNKVNLELSGDMLGLVDLIDETNNTVTLGWGDDDEAGKAHGHIVGANFLPVRDFFGLNQKDIDEIKSRFRSDINEIKTAPPSAKERAILKLIEKIDGSES